MAFRANQNYGVWVALPPAHAYKAPTVIGVSPDD